MSTLFLSLYLSVYFYFDGYALLDSDWTLLLTRRWTILDKHLEFFYKKTNRIQTTPPCVFSSSRNMYFSMPISWNSYMTRGRGRIMCSFFHISHPNNGWGVVLMMLNKSYMGGNPWDWNFKSVGNFPFQ